MAVVGAVRYGCFLAPHTATGKSFRMSPQDSWCWPCMKLSIPVMFVSPEQTCAMRINPWSS
eukprot:394323-Amphidinium_carterae.1